jgi:hypothetical protein
MRNKYIEFGYQGGKESFLLKTIGTDLPITYNINNDDCEWVQIDIIQNSVNITVQPTYDFVDRVCLISLFNSQKQELKLEVKQIGFQGIGLYCEKSLVLYKSYYDTNKYYNFYVTVYGGKTQDIVCQKLKNNIKKVWDNSDMYNDYIIQVPQELSGSFQIKHSEYNNYKKYCKKNNINFDESKVLKNIDIVQITSEEAVGEMVVSIDNVVYKTGDDIRINIDTENDVNMDILSMKYKHQLSRTAYEIVDNRDIDYGMYPQWLNITRNGDTVSFKAKEKNHGVSRCFKLKLTNRTQPHQFIEIFVTQK